MSAGYKAITWSSHKRVYDAVAVGAALGFIGLFVGVSKLASSAPNAIGDEVLLLRATGACAIVLLHVILCIGPLSRLDKRWLPVLSNRRHLGVLTFLVALVHGVVATGYYHGFGEVPALVSLLTSNTNYTSLSAFPFETLGLIALVILFALAATSHDFWLKNLSARVWKSLHMLVYVAYGLLVGHVALGALQAEGTAATVVLLSIGLAVVSGLHAAAGLREARGDRGAAASDGWIDVGTPDEIPQDRARTVCTPGGERIAVFRHGDRVSAVTNVCAHQGGPLGEGKVIDGCITCPWHGWQYRPEDGCAPPPFVEKIATYEVRISAGRVQVRASALEPGTPTPPVVVGPALVGEARP